MYSLPLLFPTNHTAGNKQGMVELATQAREAGRFNVAFLAYFLTGQVCVVMRCL